MKNYKVHTYRGETRPLYDMVNDKDYYIKDGDTYFILGNYFYLNDKSFCYVSNLISYSEYGIIMDEQKEQFIIEMFDGKYKTQLELIFEKIDKIEKILPKENISISHYQFTNDFRPITHFEYDPEKNEYSSCYLKGYSPRQLSRFIYSNVFKLVPYGTKEISSSDWEKIKKPYEY